MNIFLLSRNLKQCAQYHCDQHIVKMILESAQMLCTAHHLTGGDAPYKPVHQKHPCTLWATESLSNWRFLKDLTKELNKEFKFRYDRQEDHKSYVTIKDLQEPSIPDLGLTPFALAMPDIYKGEDAIESYRRYYAGEKHRFATWKKRPTPEWYLPLRQSLLDQGVIREGEYFKVPKGGMKKPKKQIKKKAMKVDDSDEEITFKIKAMNPDTDEEIGEFKRRISARLREKKLKND